MNSTQTLLALSLSCGALAASLTIRGAYALPFLALTPAFALATIEGTRRNGASELTAAAIEFSSLLLAGKEESKIGEIATSILIPEHVGQQAAPIDSTTNEFWTVSKALNSKLIVGSRGSGKSSLAQFFAGQIAKAGNVSLRISDRHYPNTDWLPGIPAEDFERAFLVSTALGTLSELTALAACLASRIEARDTTAKPHHLLIDEWGGCWSEWSDSQRFFALNALSRISEEGRKYGIDVTLVLHQLTKEATGINQALSSSADLYLCGDSLSNTTWSFPATLSRQRDELSSRRQLEFSAGVLPQRVLIHRDSQGLASVVIAPDLSEPERFEPVYEKDIKATLSAQLEAAYVPGMSLRKLSEAVGITDRRLTNSKYIAVKDWLAMRGTVQQD